MSEQHSHFILPASEYWKTFAKLLFLMVLTVGVAVLPSNLPFLAPMQNWSVFNNLVSLGIAVTKAVLVVQIFMGVKFGSKLTKLFAWGGFVWMLLLGIMFVDYATRPWEPVKGWEPDAPSALPRSDGAGR